MYHVSVSGILLIVYSSVLCYKVFYHFTFIPSGPLGPLISLFALGIIHLFLTWLGVYGPKREHNFHLIMFLTFTIILLICELTIGIWSMVLWDEASTISSELQTKSFLKMKESCNEKNWIKLQRQFECCGLHGADDYSEKNCKITCVDHKMLNATSDIYYNNGCQKKFIKYMKGIVIQGGVLGFLAALFQAVGVFLFITYFRSLREVRKERAARLSARQRQLSESGVPAAAWRTDATQTPDVPLMAPPIPGAPPPTAASEPVPSSPPPPGLKV
ncbi:unnamed protein product [Acanthoscelides obtectus]|uniref:Tetraspanin n=1 Tax=Acanthoscelides obtectus TaxID=200917 RepID=A0A9P0JR88_ACAOB|nr:unnamed protein product [Acanthoscelides obtectus]CAK1625450.1 hypothetical protein AOBTE_LOCUS3169 [Acanthoscelides obtectus]